MSSLLNIKIEDLHLDEEYVLIKHMKNRKQRRYPLSSYLCKITLEYLNVRNGKDDDFLFCNQFGGKLSRKGAQDAIRKYNTERGVTKTSIHLYRNNYAKEWLLSGGDMLTLQKMLNHNTLAMVL